MYGWLRRKAAKTELARMRREKPSERAAHHQTCGSSGGIGGIMAKCLTIGYWRAAGGGIWPLAANRRVSRSSGGSLRMQRGKA